MRPVTRALEVGEMRGPLCVVQVSVAKVYRMAKGYLQVCTLLKSSIYVQL